MKSLPAVCHHPIVTRQQVLSSCNEYARNNRILDGVFHMQSVSC
jgi:hypothetical protein